MIPKETLTALLVEIHQSIEESSRSVLESIGDPGATPEVHYPPNGELTVAEQEALRSLHLSEFARSGLAKLVKDAAASSFFRFFTLVDGVADPPMFLNGERVFENVWLGVSLVPKIKGEDMLHDEFYESFWAYKKPG